MGRLRMGGARRGHMPRIEERNRTERGRSNTRPSHLERVELADRIRYGGRFQIPAIGTQCGALAVVAYLIGARGGLNILECVCSCGRLAYPDFNNFASGRTRSCDHCAKQRTADWLATGTNHPGRKYKDIVVGTEYGPYRVVEKLDSRCATWIAACTKCGSYQAGPRDFFHAKRRQTHCYDCRRLPIDKSNSDAMWLYGKWHNMLGRVREQRYGEGALRLEDPRWNNLYTFIVEARTLPGYTLGPNILQLDRINNERGYCATNCRFTTQQENLENTRTHVRYQEVRAALAVRYPYAFR